AEGDEGMQEGMGLDVTVIDIAPWSSALQKLHAAITTPPPLSAYASAAVRARNCALVQSEELTCRFVQRDVLEVEGEELRAMFQGVILVTMMFTLNELYCSSIAKTTKFLFELTSAVERACLLCVVDSPGSCSTVGLNESRDKRVVDEAKGTESGSLETKDGKDYPMQWLLDHTLLEVANRDQGRGEGDKEVKKWEKLHENDSRWFRLSEELRYPIKLEDMRMQVHLYQRL
ncbi:MAG: hypothetical protein Q9218_005089, partial [Villophora microphyllina]